MFSSFPDGWPGVGLLLLRAAAGVVLLIQGFAFLRYGGELQPVGFAVTLLTMLVGALLLAGLLTRIATALSVLGSALGMFPWFPGPRVILFESRMTATLGIVIGAAIVSLGPGAFSIDARLFGRREFVIRTKPGGADL